MLLFRSKFILWISPFLRELGKISTNWQDFCICIYYTDKKNAGSYSTGTTIAIPETLQCVNLTQFIQVCIYLVHNVSQNTSLCIYILCLIQFFSENAVKKPDEKEISKISWRNKGISRASYWIPTCIFTRLILLVWCRFFFSKLLFCLHRKDMLLMWERTISGKQQIHLAILKYIFTLLII